MEQNKVYHYSLDDIKKIVDLAYTKNIVVFPKKVC